VQPGGSKVRSRCGTEDDELNPNFFSTNRQKENLFVPFALAAVTLLGAGFRFYQIGKQPLWLDEAFSVWMGAHSPPQIIQLTIDIDQHPPLYHLLLRLWMGIGGDSEAWLRSLSALFGILTIIVIYYLGKTLSGPADGLLAALVLAFSPFHIQYAQEARVYTFLALCASLSMWMTARLLLRPRARQQAIGQQFRDPNWLGYMVFTALAVYGHNTAVFLPVGINLFVLGLIVFRRFCPPQPGQMQAPPIKNWLAAQLGVLLLWSPWLVAFYYQAIGVAGDFWIQPPTVGTVTDALKTFLMAYLPDQIRWQGLLFAGFGGALILAFFAYQRKLGHFLFLAALFLTPFVGELLVSLRRPIFYDRTLIWCTIPLYVLIAAGISQLRYRPYILTAVVIFTTIGWLSISNFFHTFEKERWDQAAAYVGERIQKGDIIIFNAGWTEIPFDYYFARYNHPAGEYGAPETMFDQGVLEPRMTEADLPRLRSIISGRPRVWLVYSHNWWTDPQSLVQDTLSKNMRLLGMKNFHGMQIQLYGNR
jgi:mannosyltransferase